MATDRNVLTLREWAERENVPIRTARYWCENGQIEAENPGGRDWLVQEWAKPPENYRPRQPE